MEAMGQEGVSIGIDVGGTSCKAALVDAAGSILAQTSAPTPALRDQASCEAFCERLRCELIDDARSRGPLRTARGAGLAVPGAIGPGGELSMAPNVKMDLEAFVQAAKRSFGGVDAVLNDANAAALGEQWAGAARDYRSVLLVTLGTGIGAGIVVDGKVVAGAHGSAGEIGHIVVEPEGEPCGCGGSGCVEQYASARGLVRLARRRIAESDAEGFAIAHASDARAVFDAARAGDARAVAAVGEMSHALARALAVAACVIDPEAIVIGGGMSGSADVFLGGLRRSFSQLAVPPCRNTPLLVARLGNDAGAIGAARAAMTNAKADALQRASRQTPRARR